MAQHTETWTRKKIVILWVGLILMLIAMVLVGEGSGTILLSGREQTSLAKDVTRMVYFGGLVFVIVRLCHYRNLRKNRLRMEEETLQYYDERRQLIHEKSGGLLVDILLIALMAAVFLLGFVNMAAFETALGVLLVTAGLKIGFYQYYKRRYGE